jgi:hypothetical protein
MYTHAVWNLLLRFGFAHLALEPVLARVLAAEAAEGRAEQEDVVLHFPRECRVHLRQTQHPKNGSEKTKEIKEI